MIQAIRSKSEQMERMLGPAIERLQSMPLEKICENAGVTFQEESSEILVESLGQVIHIHYPDFEIKEELNMWHHLTILQYLFTADGVELAGRWIGLTEMRGGISRGRGYDKDIALMFSRELKSIRPEDFKKACLALGGEIVDGKADVVAVIPYAPRFKVLISFWESDDEFPSSGKTLVDANAEHYLTLEAAGGACAAIMHEIIRIFQENK